MDPIAKLKAACTRRIVVDLGADDAVTLVAGMGRSGTTWVADLLNADRTQRIMFEPFWPERVAGAGPFAWPQYLAPDAVSPRHEQAARRILAGHPLLNRWVNCDNPRFIARRRVVKDIRVNLMLAWLARLIPSMPVVWVVRHPLAVVASWLELGWILPQEQRPVVADPLLRLTGMYEELPWLRARVALFNADDALERGLLWWYLLHAVPRTQLPAGRVFLLPYETLVTQPDAVLPALSDYCGQKIGAERLRQPSSTNFRGTDVAGAGEYRWHRQIGPAQERRARELLAAAGVDWYRDDAPPPAGIWRNQ